MTTLKIEVTEKHIENAVRNNAVAGPIALAINEAGFFHTKVQYGEVYYYEAQYQIGDPHRTAVIDDDNLEEWIAQFDCNEVVAPIVVELVRSDEMYELDRLSLA